MMNTYVVFGCMAVCAVAVLALVVKSVMRLMTDRRLISWVMVGLSVAYSLIYIGGALRLVGALPWPADVVRMLQTEDVNRLRGKAGLDAEMMDLISEATTIAREGDITPLFAKPEAAAVAMCCAVSLIALNAFFFVMIGRITPENKMRWIVTSLVVFLVMLGAVGVVGTIVTGVNIVLTFFGACCAALALPGWAMGLTYKEICVIGNVYLEVGVALWSVLWFASVARQRAKLRPNFVSCTISALSVVYAVVASIGALVAVGHYAPPLEPSYDLCYHELMSLSAQTGISYEWINFIIFIFGFLAIFGFNIVCGIMLRVKQR